MNDNKIQKPTNLECEPAKIEPTKIANSKKFLGFIKLKNTHIIILVLLVAVLFIAFSFFSNNSKTTTKIKSQVETKVENILSSIVGVGNVNVMIYFKNSNTKTETSSINFNSSYLGSNIEEIKGVIVVCEGGENMKVRVEILKAVQTLLAINANNIEIFTMKK